MPSRPLCQSPREATAAPAPRLPLPPQVDPAATLAGCCCALPAFVPTSYLGRIIAERGPSGVRGTKLRWGGDIRGQRPL